VRTALRALSRLLGFKAGAGGPQTLILPLGLPFRRRYSVGWRIQPLWTVSVADDAKKAIDGAWAAASRLGAVSVGSRHLLLALMVTAEGPFQTALQALLGARLSSIAAELQVPIGRPKGGKRLPVAREFAQVLTASREEAEAGDHHTITPALLFLGIVRSEASEGNNLLDSVTALQDNRFKLISLGAIMEVYNPRDLFRFAKLSTIIQAPLVLDITGIPLSEAKALPEAARISLRGAFLILKAEWEMLGLRLSVIQADRVLSSLENAAYTDNQFIRDTQILEGRIRDELEATLFLHVSGTHAQYYISPLDRWAEVLHQFPSAVIDIEEASKCFALNRYTATVFHLMRVMEIGLRVLGDSLRDPRLNPKNNPTWERILQRCDEESSKPLGQRSAEWQADEPFFSGAAARLRAVKDAWRNPTMHVETNYTEEASLDVLNHAQAFMRHLATKLHE